MNYKIAIKPDSYGFGTNERMRKLVWNYNVISCMPDLRAREAYEFYEYMYNWWNVFDVYFQSFQDDET